jgi:hypothetical protein
MTLLHPKISEIYSIGTVIEANNPPSDNWLPCQGQILAQVDYPVLYASMDNPDPLLFSDWSFCDDYDTGGDYPYCERIQWNGSSGSPIWISDADDGNYSRSTDGITWTIETYPSTGTWYPAWSGSIFCSVKYGTNVGATSSDGDSWTARTLNLSSNWSALVWDGTYFVAISSNNTQVIRSTDGISWSNTGTLPETGFCYAASDGAGTIVTIDTSNDIAYSTNNGVNWTKVEGPQGPWNSIEYQNNLFLIATDRGYVGVSSDGISWEWINYASDQVEAFDNIGYNAAHIWRWRYYDNIYFGVTGHNNSPVGLYSFDLRTFHPWFCNPNHTVLHDVVYNSVSGNLTCFGGQTYSMPYSQRMDRYNDSTHFQLPNYFTHRFFERGKHRYIRVK